MNITFNAVTLSPALAPMAAALLALVLDVLVPKRPVLPWLVSALGLIGALVGLGVVYTRSNGSARTLCSTAGQCFWQADSTALALQGLALAASLIVVVLALLERHTAHRHDHGLVRAVMVLAATAGSVGVVAAHDVASWLIMVELATLPGIVLAALTSGARAVHGALTLLATALVSFGVLALGVALWFTATANVRLSADAFLTAYADPVRRPLLVVATLLLFAGVGFKLSLAPFHSWTPETFAGSGSWVTAFLATTSKVGALGAMLVLLDAASALGSAALIPAAVAAAISMSVGNVMALRSRGVLRFMAWSTISQAGWVVLPMTVVAAGSRSAAASYLALYLVGTLSVFVVLAALESTRAKAGRHSGGSGEMSLTSLTGLFRTHPLLAATLALGLLALAGLPPSLIGVVAKIIALKPAIAGGMWWLVIIALINAMLGVAVYLRWIALMMQPADSATVARLPQPTRVYGVLAALMLLLLVVMSLAPHLLLRWF